MKRTALTDSTLLIVAASYGAALALAHLGGVFGIPLFVLISLSLWRYAYAVLHAVARDRRTLPAPDGETMHPFGEIRLVLHFLLFGLLTFFLVTTPLLGDSAGADALRVAGFAVVVAVFPASAALVGISGNLSASVNPAALAALMRVAGRDYVILLARCAALVIVVAVVAATIGASGWLGLLPAYATAVWTLLALFALTGSTVGEHRAELLLTSERERHDAALERDRDRELQAQLDGAYASLRSGLRSEGYRTIRGLLAADNESPATYQWLLNRMSAWEDTSHARALAVRFVERLLELGRIHEALELTERHRRLSADFMPNDAAAQALGRYAREIGHHWIADELANRSTIDADRPL
jgi:hypothetical protein